MKIALATAGRLNVAALRRAIGAEPGHQIAWIAEDGAEAARLCRAQTPDLLLLDIDLPFLDGVEVTRKVMSESPCAIVIVTPDAPDAATHADLNRIYEAMNLGALDVVVAPQLTPEGELLRGPPILEKIHTVEKLIGEAPSGAADTSTQSSAPLLVAVGASTGGPRALAAILGRLPKDFPAALLVVQHIEAAYAAGLASWLTEKTGFPVDLATGKSVPRAGRAALAASGDHLVLTPNTTLSYSPDPAGGEHRPSIDVLFRSLTKHPQPGVAVLLTGMGRDGAEGLLQLRHAGWTTICQDERSSVVPAMPRAAVALGAASIVLPLEAIGPTIDATVRRLTRLR